LSHVDVKHRICDFAGGYTAADLLARLSKEARPLTETYLRRVTDRGEFLRWQSLDDLVQDGIVSAANDAYLVARAVARRVEKLKAEEQKKFDAAYSDLNAIEAQLANVTKKGDEVELAGELAGGERVEFVKITGGAASLRYHVKLPADAAGVRKVVKLKKNEIKPECVVRAPTQDTVTNSACGAISGCGFQGTVNRTSLRKHREKLKKLEAGIEERCVVEVTYNDFQAGHEAFVAECEAAPTRAAWLSLIKARAEEARMLPLEPVRTENGGRGAEKSRLATVVGAIADVAGGGYSRPRTDRKRGQQGSISDWAKAIADRAEAELAKRPVAERRGELVRRRRWAYSEPKNKAKRDALFEQIKARASTIDPADYPFTPMDAAARVAACEIERSLWSAPEGRPGRNTVASRRFQLPLRPDIDLGRLADALRDGLSFLIPTSAIEVFPLEHYVKKMEHGAKIHPHFYPFTRE
jgi:hypothetical protein